MVAGSGLGPFERMILDCRPRLRICEALNLPLSSPRRRGPIRRVVAMWCDRRQIESSVAMGLRLRGDDSNRCCATAGSLKASTLCVAPCPRLLGQIAPQPLAYLVRPLRRPGSKAFAGFHAELSGLDLLLQERMRTSAAVK